LGSSQSQPCSFVSIPTSVFPYGPKCIKLPCETTHLNTIPGKLNSQLLEHLQRAQYVTPDSKMYCEKVKMCHLAQEIDFSAAGRGW